MGQKAIVVLGGYIVKDKTTGKWRTTKYDEADNFGIIGDWYRVLAGDYLYKEHPDRVVVVSGGVGQLAAKFSDAPTIASVMKSELIELGVPADVIIMEEKSANTYQQLKQFCHLAIERGLESGLLISNMYHLGRVHAMIEANPVLGQMYRYGMLQLLDAENIVQRNDSSLGPEIVAAYASERMQERIALEKKGVGQIKNGTYRLE